TRRPNKLSAVSTHAWSDVRPPISDVRFPLAAETSSLASASVVATQISRLTYYSHRLPNPDQLRAHSPPHLLHPPRRGRTRRRHPRCARLGLANRGDPRRL